MIMLGTESAGKGKQCLHYYALDYLPYVTQSQFYDGYFSSFNNYIIIDDFEKYTNSDELINESNWYEENPTCVYCHMTFDNPKDISTFSILSFFAKTNNTESRIHINLVFETDYWGFATTLSANWERYEFEYNYADTRSETLYGITLKFDTPASSSIYFDELILIDARPAYKYNSWIPINILELEKTTNKKTSEDSNIGYYGDVIQKTKYTYFEDSITHLSFPKEYIKDTEYLNYIRRKSIPMYLRLPSDGMVILIDDIKQKYRDTYFGKTIAHTIKVKEIIYNDYGLANIYGD